MGACLSVAAPAHILENVDGDETAYHQRYLEDEVLGEGEFGQVKLVHDISGAGDKSLPLACKVLKKGVTFKDNTLYSAIRPEILAGEVQILRVLTGKYYCLKMVAIYETPRVLYMVTEYCGGGEMMEYVAARKEELRTEDVSRIAFQLLSAIDHCAKHNIIHRDVKPENVMFKDASLQSELRLIDFGSGTLDSDATTTTAPESSSTPSKDELVTHTTFAGSAFYISPEMFQRTYTQKTDVWSVGVTLYVLAAGYPSETLQKAFNILQSSKPRNLRKLPNMPDDMPESYFDLLDQLLTYRHKKRPSAGECLQSEFVRFHLELENDRGLSLDDIANQAASVESPTTGSTRGRTASIRLTGSVARHNIVMGFKKFERSLTTLLAAILSKEELKQLLQLLQERMDAAKHAPQVSVAEAAALAAAAALEEDANGESKPGEQRLQIIHINDLKAIIKDELKNESVIATMEKLPNSNLYDNFAYHVALLAEFSRARGGRSKASRRGTGSSGSALFDDDSTHSTHSVRSLRNLSRRGRHSEVSSIHGSHSISNLRKGAIPRATSVTT